MFVALIHWRIRPEEEHRDAFVKHWQTKNTITDRRGLIGEFLSDSVSIPEFPYITWHLDPESLANFRSYVTVGIWDESDDFEDQVASYFNDDGPMESFEKYRRRRVVFRPIARRIGEVELPDSDSIGVQ